MESRPVEVKRVKPCVNLSEARANTQIAGPRGSPGIVSRFSFMCRDPFGVLMFISVAVCFGNSFTAGHKGSARKHRNSSVFGLRSQINCVFVWEQGERMETAQRCSSEIHQITFRDAERNPAEVWAAELRTCCTPPPVKIKQIGAKTSRFDFV